MWYFCSCSSMISSLPALKDLLIDRYIGLSFTRCVTSIISLAIGQRLKPKERFWMIVLSQQYQVIFLCVFFLTREYSNRYKGNSFSSYIFKTLESYLQVLISYNGF